MMPTQLVNQDNHANDIRVKTVYSGDIMIIYINQNITLEEFTREMVATCRFPPHQASKVEGSKPNLINSANNLLLSMTVLCELPISVYNLISIINRIFHLSRVIYIIKLKSNKLFTFCNILWECQHCYD